MVDDTKTCSNCNKVLPADTKHFPTRRRGGKESLGSWCKQCINRYRREYYKNRVGYDSARTKKHYRDNKQRHLRLAFLRRIKRRYKLDECGFDRMIISQNGRCAICDDLLIDKMEVDHDHKSGEARGILCGDCNVSVDIVERFISLNDLVVKKLFGYIGHVL
jgi:hypothetical protein